MKTATEYLDLDNYKQYDKEIVLQMADDGYWGYVRLGFGRDEEGLYVVDLESVEDKSLLKKTRIKDNGYKLWEILDRGVALGIFSRQGGEYYYAWSDKGNNYDGWLTWKKEFGIEE